MRGGRAVRHGVGNPAGRAQPTGAPISDNEDEQVGFGVSVAGVVARVATAVLAVLAITYVVAVGAWLWTLRHHIRGPDVSTGVLLVGAAMLLAWLAGLAGAVPGATSPAPARRRTTSALGTGVCHLTDHPLGNPAPRAALQLVASWRSSPPLNSRM